MGLKRMMLETSGASSTADFDPDFVVRPALWSLSTPHTAMYFIIKIFIRYHTRARSMSAGHFFTFFDCIKLHHVVKFFLSFPKRSLVNAGVSRLTMCQSL